MAEVPNTWRRRAKQGLLGSGLSDSKQSCLICERKIGKLSSGSLIIMKEYSNLTPVFFICRMGRSICCVDYASLRVRKKLSKAMPSNSCGTQLECR